MTPAGAFRQTYRFNYGADWTLVERFAGKLGATRGWRSFRADATLVGGASDTCTSGAVSWRVATG